MSKQVIFLCLVASAVMVGLASGNPLDKLLQNLSTEQQQLMKAKLAELEDKNLEKRAFIDAIEAYASENGIDLSHMKKNNANNQLS